MKNMQRGLLENRQAFYKLRGIVVLLNKKVYNE